MYKAIITDLDGTLFNGESLISDYSAEVLRQAEKKGYTIIIATGRHHADADYIVRNAPWDKSIPHILQRRHDCFA